MNLDLGSLLAAGAALLVLLGGATAMVLRLQAQQTRYLGRVATVSGGYARAQAPRRPGGTARIEAALPLLARLGRVLGLDAARLAEYPVRWWIAMPVALVVARLLAEVSRSIVGWVALPMVPVLWILLCRGFFGWCHSRRSARLYTQFPDALSMIVRGVRVGIPVTEAIKTVAREAMAPTNVEFQTLADQLSIGVALPDALREMSLRNALPEYQFFATALALQNQTGGGLSETLENLAEVIRKRVALRNRAIALASEARTSIYILASLPVFAGAALAVLNPDYIETLFTTDTGQKVFAAALLSLGTGIVVMQGIVKKSLS